MSGFHKKLEAGPLFMAALIFISVSIGGIIEIVPISTIDENIEVLPEIKPYTPLELQGRDIYIREGCYTCHSQVVRPFLDETIRYGPLSQPGEFVYDHPFQWGSKRTGPDLARLGGKYPDSWHYSHMYNPRTIEGESIMPNYPWLFSDVLDNSDLKKKMQVLRTLGVPYSDADIEHADKILARQAKRVVANLKDVSGSEAEVIIGEGETETIVLPEVSEDKEIIALIAYLQRLGVDYKKAFEAAQKAKGGK